MVNVPFYSSLRHLKSYFEHLGQLFICLYHCNLTVHKGMAQGTSKETIERLRFNSNSARVKKWRQVKRKNCVTYWVPIKDFHDDVWRISNDIFLFFKYLDLGEDERFVPSWTSGLTLPFCHLTLVAKGNTNVRICVKWRNKLTVNFGFLFGGRSTPYLSLTLVFTVATRWSRNKARQVHHVATLRNNISHVAKLT